MDKTDKDTKDMKKEWEPTENDVKWLTEEVSSVKVGGTWKMTPHVLFRKETTDKIIFDSADTPLVSLLQLTRLLKRLQRVGQKAGIVVIVDGTIKLVMTAPVRRVKKE